MSTEIGEKLSAASSAPDLSEAAVKAWWEGFGLAALAAVEAAERLEDWTARVDGEILAALKALCEAAVKMPTRVASAMSDEMYLLRLRAVLTGVPVPLRLRVLQHLADADALPPERVSSLMDEALAGLRGLPGERPPEPVLAARVLRQSVLAMHRSWLLGSIFDPDRVALVRAAVEAAKGASHKPAEAEGVGERT